MRVLVGRLLAAIEAHRGAEVYSYFLGARAPGWWTESYGKGIGARRDHGLTLLAASGCQGLGTFDVLDFYRSVDPEVARKLLIGMGCPPGAVTNLTSTLIRLKELGGPGGLPIGFEGSGVLGNAVLYPLDAALRGNLPFVRYTDDIWVFPQYGDDWTTLRATVIDKLDALGLQINETKTQLWEHLWDDPEGVIRNRTLDSLTAAAGDDSVPADKALELLEEAAATDSPDWTVVRFALGVLGRTNDPRGVDVLEAAPTLLTEVPVNVGRYLTKLADHPPTSKRIDHEWLIERAAKGSSRELAARLHACRVASRLHLSKNDGRRFLDLATEVDNMRKAPMQVWAATAWGASEDWKPARAIDAAEHFGNLQLRRAFCLPFQRRGGGGKKGAMWKAHLGLKDPDLRATAQYAFA